jgi:hypothetical protein
MQEFPDDPPVLAPAMSEGKLSINQVIGELMDSFPSWDRESIEEVLEFCGGSIEIATETLLEVRF